ncbi:hypothetical protein GUJ93_ZPchr0013g35106 [Zizania palustris]|uniref:Uncharacterized protein n=1 Tax=Zizania palustris TaxID=103762 RepID=A0A8J5X0U7_ZIZPA|nr:hypothetical protein GUJ93_ZPchr0013g35106 [Zizania palustris]
MACFFDVLRKLLDRVKSSLAVVADLGKRALESLLRFVKRLAVAAASALAKIADHVDAAWRRFVEFLFSVVSSMAEDDYKVARKALLIGVVAVVAYSLWPAVAATGATMIAPGAPGFVISRAAFAANLKFYFFLLRTAGPKVAAATFVASPKLILHTLLTAGGNVAAAAFV